MQGLRASFGLIEKRTPRILVFARIPGRFLSLERGFFLFCFGQNPLVFSFPACYIVANRLGGNPQPYKKNKGGVQNDNP